MSQLSNMSDHDIRKLKWYYKIELRDTVFTNGNSFENIRPVRKLLNRVDLSGLKALDIGVQEGANTVLLAKAGARVAAYDRLDLSDRINLVKQAYQVEFDYYPGTPFHVFARRILAHRNPVRKLLQSVTGKVTPPFDFVLFSGVLYHVFEPGLFMWYVRNLMAPGSIMIMETSMAINREPAMHFNAAGRFIRYRNYYQVSSGWLDYMIRYFGMRIVDVEFVEKGTIDGRRIARCAMMCLVENKPQCEAGDEWGYQNFHTQLRLLDKEFGELVPLQRFRPLDNHQRANPKSFLREYYRKGVNSLDLTKVLNNKPDVGLDPDQSTLHLADRLKNGIIDPNEEKNEYRLI